MKLIKLIFIVTNFVVLSALSAWAETDVAVQFRVKRYSPGYYSNTTAEFIVRDFTDLDVQCENPALSVSFSALAPDNKRVDGQSAAVLPFKKPAERFYEVYFPQIIHARSSSLMYDVIHMQAVCVEADGVLRNIGARYSARFTMENADFDWSAWQALEIAVDN